jgi:SAM-dependent methyltransferase
MPAASTDRQFGGSIPQLYEQYLVPLIFEPYAVDLAARVATRQPARVLELAAGTGVVTRHLARTLAADATIVATDLNPPMLAEAASLGTARPVEWRQADAHGLPFADASFDVVVCQFGAMFFDKPRAFAEARRVLRDGGAFLFNVWDRIEDNEFADAVTDAVATLFPDDPPRFLARTPHGYHAPDAIAADLAQGGFTRAAKIVTVTKRSRATGPGIPAIAYCQGTPLRTEIEARGPDRLLEATGVAEARLAARFGAGHVDGKIQALVVGIER